MNTVKKFLKHFSMASNCTITLDDVSNVERGRETSLSYGDVRNEYYKGFEDYKVNMVTVRDNSLLLHIEAK